MLIRLGKVQDAIAVYDRLLALNPRDPALLIAKGDALISAGQIDQAVVAYFERAAEISKDSFGAPEWTARGGLLFRAGNYQKALEFYDKAIAADRKYARAYHDKGQVLREIPDRTAEALHNFDLAIQLEPSTAWFYVDKGNVHYDRREYELAAKCYAKAIELDPKYQVAWRNLCSTQESLKQYDQALVSAEKTIELDPTSADAWVHRGFCLGYLKRMDESIASYRKALELDPENIWANSNMGWALSEMQKNDESLPFYAAAIKVDPKEAWPWVNRAKSLRDLGQVPEALASLNEALKVVTDKREVLTGIGVIYTEFLYKHAEAVPYFKQRLELDPTDVQARCDLAECLIRMGQFAEGRTEAEKLVGQWTDPEDECGLSLIILASYALEGDAEGRARQFQVVVDHFKICCPEGKPRKQEVRWGFSGLVNTIRGSDISAESKFLVLTAIDVQQGKLAHAGLLFFSPTKPQTAETATDRSMTATAAQ